MMRKLLLLSILALGSITAQAQNPGYSGVKPQSVSFNAGTQGVGLEYRYGAFEKVSFRGGFNVLPVSVNNVFEIDDLNSNSRISAKFSNVHLLADYTPFNASFFRLVGGVAYFIKAKGDVLIKPTDTYSYGDIAIDQSQVGQVNMALDWKGVAPYLGIGLFKSFPSNKFNVNLDLGTYYLKRPSANITGTGMLEGNSSQSGQFERNVKDYRWYPQLQLSFNYRIQ